MPQVSNGTKRLGLRFASMRSSIIYIISKIKSFVRDQLAEAISLAMEGHGRYAYVEASGRNHGDRARLISPKMQGPKSLSVRYRMYGSSMGSLIIYLKTNDSEMIQWIKSGNHPDQWLQAAVFVNSSVEYQVTYSSFPQGLF